MKEMKWTPFGLPSLVYNKIYFEIISDLHNSCKKAQELPLSFILLLLVVPAHITIAQRSKSGN